MSLKIICMMSPMYKIKIITIILMTCTLVTESKDLTTITYLIIIVITTFLIHFMTHIIIIGHTDGVTPTTVGHMDGDTHITVGHMDGDTHITVGHMDGDTHITVGHMDGDTRITVGHMDGDTHTTVGHMDGDTLKIIFMDIIIA